MTNPHCIHCDGELPGFVRVPDPNIVPTEEQHYTDAQRLDWLEKAALSPGGILLHDGSEVGRTGLGIWPHTRTKRTLRDAIDGCLRFTSDF